jgi:hypothetical protein
VTSRTEELAMSTLKPPTTNRPCGASSRWNGVLPCGLVSLTRVTVVLSATLLCWETLAKEPSQDGEPAGPVLHYTFDARTDKSVENEVGDKLSGRSVGALFQRNGANGSALSVRKNQPRFGYVETANHEDLNSPKFTVAAWIKLRRKDSNGSVVCKHDWLDGKMRGFVRRCYTDKGNNFTAGAGGWKSTDGTTRMPVNQWVHVAGTFDGRFIRAFFNGRLEGTSEINTAYTPSPFPLRIGHAAYALEESRKFDGQIDDVMIWDRALTEQELLAVFRVQKRS